MSESDDTKIAGSKTCGDWRAFRDKLVPGGDRAGWDAAFSDYFWARINLRYLDPISMIQSHDAELGEGFSIVAIHRTLVEFLESTLQGIKYRFVQKDNQLGPFEYRKSGPVFVDFLSKRHPFANAFDGRLLRISTSMYVAGCYMKHAQRMAGSYALMIRLAPSWMLRIPSDRS